LQLLDILRAFVRRQCKAMDYRNVMIRMLAAASYSRQMY
jgi:hypothetical protein